MEAAKNATAEKAESKKVKSYKVTGERFKSKKNAAEKLRKVHEKGFKSAGLMVAGNEFVILFGTYATEQDARVNAEAISGKGFRAEVTPG